MPIVGFPDVCTDGVEVIGELATAQVWFDGVAVPSSEIALFLRAIVVGGVHVAIYHGAATDTAYLLSEDSTEVSLGATFGNQSVGLRAVSGQIEAVWVESQTVYKSRRFDTSLTPTTGVVSHSVPADLVGHMATGFLDLTTAGVPIWTDSNRSITVQGIPLLYAVQRGDYYVGQLGGTYGDQIVAVNGRTGQAGTVYDGLGFEPHAALGTGGTVYIAFRTLGTIGATFSSVPPLPALSASISTVAENQTDPRLYPPISHAVTDKSGLITIPWQRWAQNMANGVVAPVDLAGNVVGVLPPSNGGANQTPGAGDKSFGVIASPTQTDVLATQPTDTLNLTSDDGTVAFTLTPATNTVDFSVVTAGRQWIPLVDGAEPPALVSDGAGNLVLVAYP